MTGSLARAETPEVSPAGAIGLGNRGWSAAETNHATTANELEFSARAGFASDYIYRGTTLSDHGPAAGAAAEARFGPLYAGTTVATLKLPTQPFAEFTMAAGHPPEDCNYRFRFWHDLFRLSRRKASRRDQRHQLLGGGFPRRQKHRRVHPPRRRLRLFSERLEHRRLEPIRGGRGGFPGAGPPAPQEPRRILHDCRRLFLVRQAGSAARRLSVACLSQLAGGRDLHSQGLQPRSALLRHQSVERELLRLYWRSQRTAGRPR